MSKKLSPHCIRWDNPRTLLSIPEQNPTPEQFWGWDFNPRMFWCLGVYSTPLHCGAVTASHIHFVFVGHKYIQKSENRFSKWSHNQTKMKINYASQYQVWLAASNCLTGLVLDQICVGPWILRCQHLYSDWVIFTISQSPSQDKTRLVCYLIIGFHLSAFCTDSDSI